MSNETCERIRFAGPGSYDLEYGARVLVEAVVLYEGKTAALVTSPRTAIPQDETWVDVVISDDYPEFGLPERLSVLVAFSPEALTKHSALTAEDCIIIMPELSALEPARGANIYTLPLHKLPISDDNPAQYHTIAAIGAIAGATEVISLSAVETAIGLRSSRADEEFYLTALGWGAETFRKIFGWRRK